MAERLASWGYAVIQASHTGNKECSTVQAPRIGMLRKLQI